MFFPLFALLFVALVALNLTGCKNKVGEAAVEQKADSIASETETTYFPAIDRFLVNEIGKHYAEGDFCVPIHLTVDVDESDAENILVWGDFWVFNYRQEGDTLNTVSGGSHPGLMHIRQTEKGFQVTAFDQVEDGSGNVQSAKRIFGDKYNHFQIIHSDDGKRERIRAEVLSAYVKDHNLSATMYKDYGWPAKKLR